MTREINALELRKRFGEIMDEVRYRREPCIVTKNGRPAVVLIDIDTYRMGKGQFGQEAFIEEYSAARIRELLKQDKVDKKVLRKLRKSLDR